MDDRRGNRRRRPGARAYRRTLRTLQLARRGRLRRQAPVRDALRIRRPPREESLRGTGNADPRTKEPISAWTPWRSVRIRDFRRDRRPDQAAVATLAVQPA